MHIIWAPAPAFLDAYSVKYTYTFPDSTEQDPDTFYPKAKAADRDEKFRSSSHQSRAKQASQPAQQPL